MEAREQLKAELNAWTVKSVEADKKIKELEDSFLIPKTQGEDYPCWVLTTERIATWERIVGEKAVVDNKCAEMRYGLQTLS